MRSFRTTVSHYLCTATMTISRSASRVSITRWCVCVAVHLHDPTETCSVLSPPRAQFNVPVPLIQTYTLCTQPPDPLCLCLYCSPPRTPPLRSHGFVKVRGSRLAGNDSDLRVCGRCSWSRMQDDMSVSWLWSDRSWAMPVKRCFCS